MLDVTSAQVLVMLAILDYVLVPLVLDTELDKVEEQRQVDLKTYSVSI